MTSNLPNGLGEIALNFVEVGSWNGTYSIASQRKQEGDRGFGHLDDSCSICMTNYLPSDQIIVLPCSHGLHEHCFTAWNKDVCPFDSVEKVVKKVLFLGHSLTFTKQTSEIVHYLKANQEKINNLLKKAILFIFDKHPAFTQPEIAQLLGTLIKSFLQNLLNIYSLNENISDTYVSKCIQDLNQHFAQVTKYLIEHMTSFECNEKSIESEDSDFFKLRSLFSDNSNTPILVLGIGSILSHMGIRHDDQGIHNLAFFLNKFSEVLVNSQEFTLFAEDTDRSFFTKHFKAIRNLSNEQACVSYLASMKADDLQRLYRLNTGGGPTSLTIRRNVEKMQRKKAQKEWCSDILFKTTIIVATLAIVTLQILDRISQSRD